MIPTSGRSQYLFYRNNGRWTNHSFRLQNERYPDWEDRSRNQLSENVSEKH